MCPNQWIDPMVLHITPIVIPFPFQSCPGTAVSNPNGPIIRTREYKLFPPPEAKTMLLGTFVGHLTIMAIERAILRNT